MKDLDSRPMSLDGPFSTERSRLSGKFSEADREWRKKFLKAQELSHHEPRVVPDVNRYNPIRRAYRFPLDFIFSKLEPTLGKSTKALRYWTGKYILIGFGILAVNYYFKYNAHDWTRKRGWAVYTSKGAVFPGQPGFPSVSTKKHPSDYADYGFKNSPI